ncbi:MAG: glycerol kinase GlpK, partial [Candidatus Sericytochromatia bacterium]
GSTVILFDRQGRPVAKGYKEITQYYPKPGWVGHDAEEIWQRTLEAIGECLQKAGVDGSAVAGIGITNQRETTVVWDRATGKPVDHAIVWQCRRTADYCQQLNQRGLAPMVQAKTGLVIDAYFSGTKVRWLLKDQPGRMERAKAGELAFGTIDSWLLYNLTGGKVHATDVTNASRSMLFDIHSLSWDDELLAAIEVPRAVLPEVRPNACRFGETVACGPLPAGIPIAAMAGDQHAALFGQACFEVGMAKNTYGTGCFMLMNTGEKPVVSHNKLLTTMGWQLDGQAPVYALEGSVFIAGAAIQWLRDELGFIKDAAESETLALSVPDNGGVYLVPAFVGLGAPYWDGFARGALMGLTRGSGRGQITRAALEAIAYQTKDILEAMVADSGIELAELKVDGGATANNFLMQFQADMLDVPVARQNNVESTAWGSAAMAGLVLGFWKDQAELASLQTGDRRFEPAMETAERKRLYAGWKKAVGRSRQWVESETPVQV